MPYQHLAVHNRGDVAILRIPGVALDSIHEFNYPNPAVKALREEFGEALAVAPRGIVLDISEATGLNHASMDFVVQLVRETMGRKIPRTICCSADVKSVLELCRIDSLVAIDTDLEIAVARASEIGGMR